MHIHIRTRAHTGTRIRAYAEGILHTDTPRIKRVFIRYCKRARSAGSQLVSFLAFSFSRPLPLSLFLSFFLSLFTGRRDILGVRGLKIHIYVSFDHLELDKMNWTRSIFLPFLFQSLASHFEPSLILKNVDYSIKLHIR